MVHTTTTTKRWQSEGTNDSCQIKPNVSLLLLLLVVKCCKYVCVCERTTRATTSFVSNSIILSFAIVNIHTNKCSSALAFAKYTHINSEREQERERDRQRESYETHLMINNDFSLKSIIKKKKKIERKKEEEEKRKAITSNYVSNNKV